VDKLVANLVDNMIQKRGNASHHQLRKRLKN
jgi:hypothetical protein